MAIINKEKKHRELELILKSIRMMYSQRSGSGRISLIEESQKMH